MVYSEHEGSYYPPERFKIKQYDFQQEDILKLISLIMDNSGEREIDSFLRSKPSLLAFTSMFFWTGHQGKWIIPQAEIKPGGFVGKGKIPDYLFAGDNSDGMTWWVVDLKSPKDRLYKKGKNGFLVESAELAAGISQVRDYVSYCAENQAFIRDALGLRSFTSPKGVLIIGRESELKQDINKQKLKANFNRDSQNIEIRTFDAFIRQTSMYAKASHELPFMAKIYSSLFIKDEIFPFDKQVDFDKKGD
jgi:hypothetical protein